MTFRTFKLSPSPYAILGLLRSLLSLWRPSDSSVNSWYPQLRPHKRFVTDSMGITDLPGILIVLGKSVSHSEPSTLPMTRIKLDVKSVYGR